MNQSEGSNYKVPVKTELVNGGTRQKGPVKRDQSKGPVIQDQTIGPFKQDQLKGTSKI